MRKMIEGSRAVAEAVGLCRPGVISAYPITPQTHIVEELSQLVADGDINAEYVRVESEHSAASVCLGAVAAGSRSYSATTSQGLLLMVEVLFNIAGMRLPMVITGVNRAISAPLNIWNDQQDTHDHPRHAVGSSSTPKTTRKPWTCTSRPSRSPRTIGCCCP